MIISFPRLNPHPGPLPKGEGDSIRSSAPQLVLDCSFAMPVQIRRATPDEAEALTALAHAAKRHWGYPEEWINHWRADLTITPDFIATNEVFAATIDGEIAGCFALVSSETLTEL